MRKTCTKCGETKFLDEFHKDSQKKFGLRPDCKLCKNKKKLKVTKAKYYLENKETIKVIRAKYYLENKETINRNHKIYRQKNLEKYREHQYRWRLGHKEQIKIRNKKYREKNYDYIIKIASVYRELHKEQRAEYYKNNKHKFNSYNSKRRARKLGQTSHSANSEQIEQFYKEAQRITKETGVKMHVDHIIPLSKGGLHHQGNLQVITATENLRKKDKLIWT